MIVKDRFGWAWPVQLWTQLPCRVCLASVPVLKVGVPVPGGRKLLGSADELFDVSNGLHRDSDQSTH